MSKARLKRWLWAMLIWSIRGFGVILVAGLTAAGTATATVVQSGGDGIFTTASAWNWQQVWHLFLLQWIVCAVPLLLAYLKQSPLPVPEEDPPLRKTRTVLQKVGIILAPLVVIVSCMSPRGEPAVRPYVHADREGYQAGVEGTWRAIWESLTMAFRKPDLSKQEDAPE